MFFFPTSDLNNLDVLILFPKIWDIQIVLIRKYNHFRSSVRILTCRNAKTYIHLENNIYRTFLRILVILVSQNE